ncbi:MAG: hypothetical protein FDX18_09400 [Chlorobium sp.]|nr:MAG: hypothetical protein FDX18_09400 [Chlorobium sp.]
MSDSLLPEGIVKPAAALAGSAFLMSPIGIPFFVKGVPRIILAGLGGLIAGQVAEMVAEGIEQIMPDQEEE